MLKWISEEILSEFFKAHRENVIDMSIYEYDE